MQQSKKRKVTFLILKKNNLKYEFSNTDSYAEVKQLYFSNSHFVFRDLITLITSAN